MNVKELMRELVNDFGKLLENEKNFDAIFDAYNVCSTDELNSLPIIYDLRNKKDIIALASIDILPTMYRDYLGYRYIVVSETTIKPLTKKEVCEYCKIFADEIVEAVIKYPHVQAYYPIYSHLVTSKFE